MRRSLYVLALTALAAIMVGLTYAALIHREVDATVRLDSAPFESTAQPLHEGTTFRVAVASVMSPLKSFKAYDHISDLMAAEFGLPLEMITPPTYAEANDLLRNGHADVAFVCSGGYASAPDAMDVIAAPTFNGKPLYKAFIIVPAESPASSLLDLKGMKFLYTEPDSNTGYWYPLELILQAGEDPETFFSETQWTGSHDHSILAISQKMAAGAAVSSIVFNLMANNDPELARKVRVIERSADYPSPPVVVRKTMPQSGRNRLVRILIGLDNTQRGRDILSGLGIDGFIPADNSTYKNIHPPEYTQ